jgi:hypothetical protein
LGSNCRRPKNKTQKTGKKKKKQKKNKNKKRVLKAAGFVCRQSKPMITCLKQPEAKRHHTERLFRDAERLFRDEIEARASLSRTRHAGSLKTRKGGSELDRPRSLAHSLSAVDGKMKKERKQAKKGKSHKR